MASTQAAKIDDSDETPPANRQQQRSELSTARLLAAAAELFAEHGYRETTLAEIGERAGYSHGLITRRFGSKHALLVALLDRMVNDWLSSTLLPTLGERTGIVGIRASYAAFCDNAKGNASNLRAFESLMFEGLWGEPELKKRLSDHQQNAQEQYEVLVQRGIDDGTVSADVDAKAIAMLASSALRGATYRWLLEDDFDLCAALNMFGDVLTAMVETPGRKSAKSSAKSTAKSPAKSPARNASARKRATKHA